MQTDYIDLLQIHWPDRYVPLFGPNKYDITLETPAVPFEEQLEAMNELIQQVLTAHSCLPACLVLMQSQGKIRHWGLSNETPFGVMAFVSLALEQGMAKPVSVQNSYSLLTREFEAGLAEVDRFLNVLLLVLTIIARFALHLTPTQPSSHTLPCLLES